MNNVSNLFENLMTFSETTKKKLTENDTTMLNLAVEIPTNTEDITPEDVQVDVGIMSLANEEQDEEDTKESNENSEENSEETNEENSEESEVEETSEEVTEEALELNDDNCVDCKQEKSDVETAKKNIKNRVASSKVESGIRLDSASLNILIEQFIKENYKNISKVYITKAILENKRLSIQGSLINTKGVKESFTIINKGFDAKLLEGKRFLMDFEDASNTFNVVKESASNPFIFKAVVDNNILKFESMKYAFRTRLNESKVAKIYGKCSLMKEAMPGVYTDNENRDDVLDRIRMDMKETEKKKKLDTIYNAAKKLKFYSSDADFKKSVDNGYDNQLGMVDEGVIITENEASLKKFDEIQNKIKNSKTLDELIKHKSEIDSSSMPNALKDTLQLMWNEVNSKLSK